MLKEFKEFAMRGNVIDMAVGIIIGTAFGKIVSSLVNDIVMPPIGVILGNVDFSEIYLNLSGMSFESLAQAKEAGAATVNVGVFFNTLIDFVIVALAIFILVRAINQLKRKQEAPPPAPVTKECPLCLSSVPIKASKCAYCTSDL